MGSVMATVRVELVGQGNGIQMCTGQRVIILPNDMRSHTAAEPTGLASWPGPDVADADRDHMS